MAAKKRTVWYRSRANKADEWLEQKVNRRVDGEIDPLKEDDQQRLEQQQLDVNRTSDTGTDEEMRRWSSAKRQ
jgi:hypothetical protein